MEFPLFIAPDVAAFVGFPARRVSRAFVTHSSDIPVFVCREVAALVGYPARQISRAFVEPPHSIRYVLLNEVDTDAAVTIAALHQEADHEDEDMCHQSVRLSRSIPASPDECAHT